MKHIDEMEVERLTDTGHMVIKVELDFLDLYERMGEGAQKVMKKFKEAGKEKMLMNHLVDWYLGLGTGLTLYGLPDEKELDWHIANEVTTNFEEG